MEWLKKLKSLLNINIDLSSLTEFNLFNIQIISNSNNTQEVIEDTDNNLLQINLHNLDDAKKEALKTILPEAFKETENLLEASARNTLEDYQEASSTDAFQDTISYFSAIIPAADMPILRASLYLNACFDKGMPVHNLKQEIFEKYGPRGRNIANLYSAGYFEDWIKPLHEALKDNAEDEGAARKDFLRMYNNIVEELPWTVFVSYASKDGEIKNEIINKLHKNIQYGIAFLNIHGLGDKNVQKIRAVVDEIEDEFPDIQKSIEEEDGRIFVRLRLLPASTEGKQG